MGIGPIPAIRTLPTAKALKVDPGLTGFLDIEQTSASKEDTFTPGDETAPGGQDDAAPEEEEHQQQASEESPEDNANPSVDLFA